MKLQIKVVRYVTLLVDLDESKVIYATKGKGASTITSLRETNDSNEQKTVIEWLEKMGLM